MLQKWSKVVKKTQSAYAMLEQAERIRQHGLKISEGLAGGRGSEPKTQAILADVTRFFDIAEKMDRRAHRTLERLRTASV